jgi:hypothetical protein
MFLLIFKLKTNQHKPSACIPPPPPPTKKIALIWALNLLSLSVSL